MNAGPDDRDYAQPSAIYLKDKDIDTNSVLGFDVPRQGGLYILGFNVRTGMEFPVVWRSPGNTNTEMSGYVCPLVGRNPLDPDSHDPERRSLNGGRMQGAYTTRWHGDQLTARWSICREGTACPPPPTGSESGPATPTPDPCGDMAAERGLVDVIWDQRQSMLPSLGRDWNELEAAQKEVMFNLEAWSAAVATCAIQDIVTTVLGELAGDFGKALDLIQKITSGDLSYLNQSDDVSAVLQILDAASSIAGAGDPANMRDRIAGCAGLPQNLRDAANAFVNNYEKVRQLAPRLQQQVNQIKQKDQRYWDQWQQYYRKCLEYAQCKNLPPSTCPAPPSTPSGPMPR